MWDDHGFAVIAFTSPHREQLAAFHARVQAGQVVFAGTLFRQHHLAGVILADINFVSQEDVASAQAEFERNVQLYVLSRVEELNALMREKLSPNLLYPFIWPVWSTRHPDQVAYAINTDAASAAYYGPYSFEEIATWINANRGYKLIPKEHAR